jgi:hypothetical protein
MIDRRPSGTAVIKRSGSGVSGGGKPVMLTGVE